MDSHLAAAAAAGAPQLGSGPVLPPLRLWAANTHTHTLRCTARPHLHARIGLSSRSHLSLGERCSDDPRGALRMMMKMKAPFHGQRELPQRPRVPHADTHTPSLIDPSPRVPLKLPVTSAGQEEAPCWAVTSRSGLTDVITSSNVLKMTDKVQHLTFLIS